MRLRDSTLFLTPTDIPNHLACRHLTQLDRVRIEGRLDIELRQDPRIEAPHRRDDALTTYPGAIAWASHLKPAVVVLRTEATRRRDAGHDDRWGEDPLQ
jgi:hypothetical protein